MRFSWFWALFVGGAILVSLSACDDSSSVGLGVGPDSLSGGNPKTLDIRASLDTSNSVPQTGLELRAGPGSQIGPSTWRFLVGRVDDPIGGTIEADGYFDFQGRSILPNDVLDAEAENLTVQLRLTPTYVHGDTSAPIEIRVLGLSEEAAMDQARADTTFPAGNEITTASISPTDSLVTVNLPESWISDNLEVLQDTTNAGNRFEEDFHGFKLVPAGGNAVVGFSSTTASLHLLTFPDSTTATYSGLKTFTHIERRNAPPPPENRILLQGGIGTELTMKWDFDDNPLDSLKNSPLNRAEIFVPTDTSTLKAHSGGDSFVRPFAKGFRVTGVRAPGPDRPSCTALGSIQRPDIENACLLPLVPGAAPGAALVSNNVAFPVFEQSLLQEPVFTEIRVEVADRPSTSINPNSTIRPGLPSTLPVLIPTPEAETLDPPRAVLTVTPL